MTISYSLEAATSSSTRFFRLMLKWKGSVWQSIWHELLAWCVGYGLLSIIYRLALNDEQKTLFEKLSLVCAQYAEYIPLTFMLGFYVSFVINRWWDQFLNIGWMDTPLYLLATYVRGNDEGALVVRRSCARWLVLSQVLLLRDISPSIRKRFPTIQHLIDANLLTESENELLENFQFTNHHKYFIPIQWCCTLLSKARDEGRIESDLLLQHLTSQITSFKSGLALIFSYDWVSIPLVYTQVVNLGVRTYFFFALLGRQYLRAHEAATFADSIDLYVPIFTIVQFVFITGWLKVAEVLMNPLGEDDDDFELNYIVTRNIQVGLYMNDENYGVLPKLERDAFWDNNEDVDLPHTEASRAKADYRAVGSCADMRVSKKDAAVFNHRSVRHRQNAVRKRSQTALGQQQNGFERSSSLDQRRSPLSRTAPSTPVKRRFSMLNQLLHKHMEQNCSNSGSESPRKLADLEPPSNDDKSDISSLDASIRDTNDTETNAEMTKPSYEYTSTLPVILENTEWKVMEA